MWFPAARGAGGEPNYSSGGSCGSCGGISSTTDQSNSRGGGVVCPYVTYGVVSDYIDK